MSNYTIVIPTYYREMFIWERGTLSFLHKMKIPKEKIILFVANKEQDKLYKNSVPKNLYSGKIVIGQKGVVNVRNFIVKYFPEDAYIISIDDDIEDIKYKINPKQLRSVTPAQLKNLFINSYNIMRQSGSYIWGINVVSNPFMMQDKIVTSSGIIPAGFYGWINRKNMVNKIKNDSREDVERSIMYFKRDKVVIRYSFITFKTNMKNTEGGIQALMAKEKRNQLEDVFTKELMKRYPQYCCYHKPGGCRITLIRNRSNIQFKPVNVLSNKLTLTAIQKSIIIKENKQKTKKNTGVKKKKTFKNI
jgi:hypothetical protein